MNAGATASQQSYLALNSHHVWKMVALLCMTLDHVGSYLLVDNLWLRAVGRMAFPIFLFLVGHALVYRVRRNTIYWAVGMLLINPFLGNAVFPFNVLVTIIGCQWLLAQVEQRDWFVRFPWTLVVGCVALWVPSVVFSEFGSIGFLYALMGYAVRSGKINSVAGYAVTTLAFAGLLGGMSLTYDFTMLQMLVATLGVTLVTILLVNFTHRPVAWVGVPDWAKHVGYFLSRHSMQYYVLHRLILQAIGTATGVLNTTFRWIQ